MVVFYQDECLRNMDNLVDIRGENADKVDNEFDNKLRPLKFNDFSGQSKIVENLKIFVKAAVMRGEPLDHVLITIFFLESILA